MNSKENCCVYGCSNTRANTKRKGLSTRFYSFPSRPWLKERRLQWITFVKRQGTNGKLWEPTKNSRICNAHFINGSKSEDPRSPSYNPMIHPTTPKVCKLPTVERYDRARKRETVKTSRAIILNNEGFGEDENTIHVESELNDSPNHVVLVSKKEAGVQTTENGFQGELLLFQSQIDENNLATTVQHQNILKKTFTNAQTGPDNKIAYFSGFSSVCDTKLKHFTSVSRNVFSLLLSLFPNHQARMGELLLEDKLLITLIKLKSALPFSTIAGFFDVHESTAARHFDFVITHIYRTPKDWIIFPSQNAVRSTLPKSFMENYSSCRVIIDCTEIPTETPSTVEQRVHMYSHYKGSYTAKYLVGISPLGLITFISNGYGGRATDSFITNDCGILEKLELGDTILADKGFPNVRVMDGVLLVMPPFASRNESQFSTEAVNLTYKIASVRIHVERAIQRLKIFKVLSSKVPVDMLYRLDMIMHVCCLLVNLGPPLIKEK